MVERVEEKKMPVEKIAHIGRNRTDSKRIREHETAIAVTGLDMLKIYLSCSSSTEG